MKPKDDVTFLKWLTTLAECFPASRVNVETVFHPYFQAMREIPVTLLGPLMAHVLATCKYFPTVYELREAAQQLGGGDACPRCPAGHGAHTGHDIRHYPAGPWCATCEADLPPPAGYLSAPLHQATGPPLLPQTTRELSRTEVREIVQDVLDAMECRSLALEAYIRPDADGHYTSSLSPAERARRRARLQRQAEAMREADLGETH
jgi:hypothetical protein